MPLSRYAVDPVTGFVPATPPLRSLPDDFAPWEAIVPEMSALLRSRHLRSVLRRLPVLDVNALQTDGERERALLLLSHFANGWVWGGPAPDLRIPAAVSIPLCALAASLGRPPIAHYASMTLNNWQLVDADAPLSVDNARTQVQFLGGVDEDWFFIASMGVELAGAPLLPHVADADVVSREGSDEELTVLLDALAEGMTGVQTALQRIREWCDPGTYYLRVRPFLAGWPDPGVLYEGVHDEPRKYLGGSAAQSSLMQVLDALLGLAHAEAPAGKYLRAIRAYMPPLHRAFVEDIERDARVRERALGGSAPLRAAYNTALDQMATFRELHMQLARDFIIRPSGATHDPQGTGGTALTSFLRGAQGTTTEAKL